MKFICKKCGIEFDSTRKDRKYCDNCKTNTKYKSISKQKENQLLIKFIGKHSRKQFYVDINKAKPKRIIYSYTYDTWETNPLYHFDAVNTYNKLTFEDSYTEKNYFETEKGFTQTIESKYKKEHLHITLKDTPILIDKPNHIYQISLIYERIFYHIVNENANNTLNKYLNNNPDVVCINITNLMKEALKKSKTNKQNRVKTKKENTSHKKKRVFRPLNYSDKVNWDLVHFDWDKQPTILQLDKKGKYYTGWVPDIDFIVIDKYDKNQSFIQAFLIGTIEIKDDFAPSSDMRFSNKPPSNEDILGCKDYSVDNIKNEENWVCDAIELFRKVKDVEIDIQQGDIKRSDWYNNIKYVLKPEMVLDEGHINFQLSKSKMNYYCALPDKILFINNKNPSSRLKLYVFDRFPKE